MTEQQMAAEHQQQQQAMAMIASINARLAAMKEQRDRAITAELDALIKARLEEDQRKTTEQALAEQGKAIAAFEAEIASLRRQVEEFAAQRVAEKAAAAAAKAQADGVNVRVEVNGTIPTDDLAQAA